MKFISARLGVMSALVLLAVMSRFLPHPPNFTALSAVALFSGASFDKKHFAFIIPFTAMLLSDVILEITTGWGFHANMFSVYASFGLIVLLSQKINRSHRVNTIAATVPAATAIFFIITNFSVWATGSFYPYTLEGLVACYVAAIPFALNQLVGDVFFTAALFGVWSLAKMASPALRPQILHSNETNLI